MVVSSPMNLLFLILAIVVISLLSVGITGFAIALTVKKRKINASEEPQKIKIPQKSSLLSSIFVGPPREERFIVVESGDITMPMTKRVQISTQSSEAVMNGMLHETFLTSESILEDLSERALSIVSNETSTIFYKEKEGKHLFEEETKDATADGDGGYCETQFLVPSVNYSTEDNFQRRCHEDSTLDETSGDIQTSCTSSVPLPNLILTVKSARCTMSPRNSEIQNNISRNSVKPVSPADDKHLECKVEDLISSLSLSSEDTEHHFPESSSNSVFSFVKPSDVKLSAIIRGHGNPVSAENEEKQTWDQVVKMTYAAAKQNLKSHQDYGEEERHSP